VCAKAHCKLGHSGAFRGIWGVYGGLRPSVQLSVFSGRPTRGRSENTEISMGADTGI
jgi:hypothetical protein